MDLNTPPSQISQIPSSAPLTKPHRHKEYFFLAIAIVIIAAGLIWWQISKYSQEQEFVLPTPTATPNADTQEINSINKDMEDANISDLDTEFKDIDKDLNSL
jgi:cytoskeletal protein RodZ